MKVSANKDESFTPVTLTITFEKQEEFKAFRELMARDSTVPAYLLAKNLIGQDQQVPMSKLMYEIWCKLQLTHNRRGCSLHLNTPFHEIKSRGGF